MKTVRVSPNWSTQSINGSYTNTVAASSQVVDAYAQEVLESHSEQSPDKSLGAYVTSLLRHTDLQEDVTRLAEFDSLVELLQEHCSMTASKAQEALETIATAVRTGQVPSQQYSPGLHSMQPLTNSLPIIEDEPDEFPPLQKESPSKNVISPTQEDNLIPHDLLGALDDPLSEDTTEESTLLQGPESVSSSSQTKDSFSAHKTSSPPPSSKKGKGRKASEKQATDLAASLFRPSRSRQSSIDETSPKMQPTTAPPPDPYVVLPEVYTGAVEMLLSVNPDLSEQAAMAAAQLSQADVNVAQYLVDSAQNAAPVCRHLLNDGCYRSDCQFSHDIEGHTCVFWLRGRCGKGDSCRFKHGFNEALLENIPNNNMYHEGGYTELNPYYGGTAYDSISSPPFMQGQGYNTCSSSWQDTSNAFAGTGFSFANIASHGYAPTSFATTAGPRAAPTAAMTVQQTVRIPQDLWNPHENRDSGIFYIADPLERNKQVQMTTRRDDVIDLHFQSTKTFPVVLSARLPEKLERHEEVWIVTGTGHHVGSQTHQKGGGALERAVVSWLEDEGYHYYRGRDRNGQGGAVLVKR